MLCNSAPFAAREGGFGGVPGRQDFCPPTLTLFPQRKRLPDCFRSSAKSAAVYGLANEGFLISSQIYVHESKAEAKECGVKDKHISTQKKRKQETSGQTRTNGVKVAPANRHRGKGHPSSLPHPYMQVRIRRFGGLS
jgi:hypothetical protein